MKLKIGDEKDVVVSRRESNFDRACDEAYYHALIIFDIDEDGHSGEVEGWQRSCCWIEVEFKKYIRTGSMGGLKHKYIFVARTQKCED